MISVLRYTVSRCALSSAWLPPWLVYVIVIAVAYPPVTPALGSLGIGALVLLPVSAWLAIATLQGESEQQSRSMGAISGGAAKYRMLMLASGLGAAALLIPISVIVALLRNAGPIRVEDVVSAALVHLVCAIAGTTIGAFTARPIIRAVGLRFVVASLAVVALIAIPHLPPGRLVIDLLESPSPSVGRLLAETGITVATIAAATASWWASAALAIRRG